MKTTFRYVVLFVTVTASMATPVLGQIPESWVGTWRGEMMNYNARGESQAIPVTLTIRQLDDGSYLWQTIYNMDEVHGLRDYRLVPVPDSETEFYLDEQNGIRLQARLFGGSLVQPFSVGGQTLVSRFMEDQTDHLVHEILHWPEDGPEVSTGTGANGESGQLVRSFGLGGIQRTVFTRASGPPGNE